MSRPEIRLLLVEDDPDTARLIERRLSWSTSARFAVDVATHLQDALLRIESDSYDVALVDLGLPDSPAMSTISFVAGLSRHLPIVVSTALDDDGAALLAARLGVQDYLVKGNIEPRKLSRSLLSAIHRHGWLRRADAFARIEADVVASSRAAVAQEPRA